MAAPTHLDQFRTQLVRNLRNSSDNEHEVETDLVLRDLDSLDPRLRQKALALCLSVSTAGSYLVVSTIRRIKKAAQVLRVKDLERWITKGFDILESQGTGPFLRFFSKTDDESLGEFRSGEALVLTSVASALELYLRAFSGMPLKVQPSDTAHTDTETIFLPPELARCHYEAGHHLLYKLMALHQWSLIARGSLSPERTLLKQFHPGRLPEHAGLSDLIRMYPERRLALDLYNILEAIRHMGYLRRELPGLMRDSDGLRKDLFVERPAIDDLTPKTALVEALYQHFLQGRVHGRMPQHISNALSSVKADGESLRQGDTLRHLAALYELAQALPGEYLPIHDTIVGTIEPEEVAMVLKVRQEALKKQLERVISKLIDMPDREIEIQQKKALRPGIQHLQKGQGEYFQLRGKVFEIDQEIKEALDEMGLLSEGLLVDRSSMKEGATVLRLREFIGRDEDDELPELGIRYDEWDYRSGDYRKQWCNIVEMNAHPSTDPFVDQTLRRYWGYVKNLRQKFELLKRELRVLRRQKEGDDIDIDAVVDAFTDRRAGLAPSENLFTKLDRQERSIAALFLLDMSGSTKGWIHEAEKEALVLLCEALDALGDDYAIFGFSGIARSNCEFYRIKTFRDHYGNMVKQRIAGIIPKDYTRMGAPIRHATHLLKGVDARARVLIVLSDGKPEDRDAYRGEYGIEDTRKALIEAREQGVQPFCITIDKEASTYLPHLFGPVSYIVLDDVKKLPNKITEIYRRLTI